MTWILAAALTRPARGEASGRSHLASTLSPSRLHVTGLYWQQCGRLGRPPGKLGGARARHRARPATARAGGDTGWRPPGGWSAVFAACGHRFSQPSARGGNRLWRFTRSSEFRTTDSRQRCAPPLPAPQDQPTGTARSPNVPPSSTALEVMEKWDCQLCRPEIGSQPAPQVAYFWPAVFQPAPRPRTGSRGCRCAHFQAPRPSSAEEMAYHPELTRRPPCGLEGAPGSGKRSLLASWLGSALPALAVR